MKRIFIALFLCFALLLFCEAIKKDRDNTTEVELSDRVDLNVVLDPDSEDLDIDWNYVPAEEIPWDYLDSLGIWYDGDNGCYRKRK
jgi:hypothetical protein